MSIGNPIALSQIIQCLKCHRIMMVSELRTQNGKSVPKQDGSGNWQERFFYCPCDSEHPLVWDPGDEKIETVPLSKMKIVTNPSIRPDSEPVFLASPGYADEKESESL